MSNYAKSWSYHAKLYSSISVKKYKQKLLMGPRLLNSSYVRTTVEVYVGVCMVIY